MLNVTFKGLDKLVLEDLVKLRNVVKIALWEYGVARK
jgi:hypothetical protein